MDTTHIGAYVILSPVDYSVCCRSHYLLVRWKPRNKWSDQGFPNDLVPDNDYASLPVTCVCKELDLSFQTKGSEDVITVAPENSISLNLEVMSDSKQSY